MPTTTSIGRPCTHLSSPRVFLACGLPACLHACLFRSPSFPSLSRSRSHALHPSSPLSLSPSRQSARHTYTRIHIHAQRYRERLLSLSRMFSLSLSLSSSRWLSLAVSTSLASHRIPPPLPPLLCLFLTRSRTLARASHVSPALPLNVDRAVSLPSVRSRTCPPPSPMARTSVSFAHLATLPCSQCPCAGMQGLRCWLAVACMLLGDPHLEFAQGP